MKTQIRGKELTGMRFGRLVVIRRDEENQSHHEKVWICKCDCGNEKSVTTSHLTTGSVRSCGCIRKEQAITRFKKAAGDNITHGKSGTHLYSIWEGMKQRCKNPDNPVYRWYGGKGVRVCDEWQDFSTFAEWSYSHGYIDLQDIPRSEKLSIDRIDSDGNYCPENCQWITISENTRKGAKSRWKNAKCSV